ncbi:MAG TPA: tetratricopeptide repeat protein [Bryobacteraceae bacterium]|nr:tetratricopeptide repeat protein [Bryobacteraceae bacterium]
MPSFARRLWNAVKPPPAVSQWHPTPRQKRMLISAGSALAAILLTGGVWVYITSAPQRAQTQLEQGTRLMIPGSYRDAVKRFDRSIQIWPHLADAYYQRGIAHHLLGDADAATEDLTSAIAENPQLGAAYTERGTIFRDHRDLERALADFTRAVEVNPSPNGFYQRGQTYASLGQPQKAIEDFDRAIAELPDAPAIYRARAEAKRSLGDMAGYKADHDVAIRNEYGDVPPAWVDRPLPPDSPGVVFGGPAPEASQKKPPANSKPRATRPKE